MPLNTVARHTGLAISEAVLVRDVPDEILVLDGDVAPLLVMTTNVKRKKPAISPRVEAIEDDVRGLWAYHNAAAISSVATGVLVNDGTLFQPGDIVACVRPSTDSSVEEVIRVTAVANNTLTVTRNIGGSGADTISASMPLRIIGSAYAENATLANVRSTSKTTVTSYCQIFREPFALSGTQLASKTYGGPEEKYQDMKALKEIKKQMEAASLWSRASEDLTGTHPVRTTMGFKSRVTSNVTDVNTTLTMTVFNTFSRTCFRYHTDRPRLFIAAPIYIEAINFFSQQDLMTEVGQKVYGVNVKVLDLPHGRLLLARNWLMEAGISGLAGYDDEAYAVDIANIAWRVLRPLQQHFDVIKNGADGKTHEYRAEQAFLLTEEKSHAWMREASAYS